METKNGTPEIQVYRFLSKNSFARTNLFDFAVGGGKIQVGGGRIVYHAHIHAEPQLLEGVDIIKYFDVDIKYD